MKQLPKAVLLASLMMGGHAMAQNLTVDFHGVHNDVGKVRFELYNESRLFRKEAHALKILEVPAHKGTVTVEFTDLQPGAYAIMVYQDEDSNGHLNLALGMIPEEGYGLSNNPHPFGPPTFEDSEFKIEDKDLHIGIEARY